MNLLKRLRRRPVMERNRLDTVERELKLRRLLFSSIPSLMMNLNIHSQHSSGKSDAIVIAAGGEYGNSENLALNETDGGGRMQEVVDFGWS